TDSIFAKIAINIKEIRSMAAKAAEITLAVASFRFVISFEPVPRLKKKGAATTIAKDAYNIPDNHQKPDALGASTVESVCPKLLNPLKLLKILTKLIIHRKTINIGPIQPKI